MKFLVFNDRGKRIKNLETYKQERRAYAGSLDYLEIETIETHIKKYYRLLYKDRKEVWREYIVTDIEEVHDSNGTSFSIYAENSLIETKWAFIEDRRSYGQYPQNAITTALQDTRWEGVSTVVVNRDVNFYRISVFEAIERIMKTWNLEIKTEINVSRNKVLSRKIYFQPQVGRVLSKRFSWTKDMIEVSRRVNDNEIITALYGFGNSLQTEGGGYGRKLDFSSVNDGLMYVTDEVAKAKYGYIGKQGALQHRFGKQDFRTDDPTELLNLTKESLKTLSAPKVTYKASVIDLASYGYDFEEVEAGDFVGVRDKELNIAIKARITELTEDLDGIEAKKLVIGNFVDTIATSMTKLQSTVDVLDQQTQEQINQVANIVKQTADGQNHIFFGPDEPTAFKNNDIWFKLLPSGIEVLHRWNGSAWVEVVDPQKMDTAVQAIQDIEQKAQEAFTKAEKATQEATKAITGLSTKADLTDLQKTDNDILTIQGRLDPTIPDSLAYQVASHTSTIAEQGGRLETLRGDFDGLELGGRNLLLNSKTLTLSSPHTIVDYLGYKNVTKVLNPVDKTYINPQEQYSDDVNSEDEYIFSVDFAYEGIKGPTPRLYIGSYKSVQGNIEEGKFNRIYIKSKKTARIHMDFSGYSEIYLTNWKLEKGNIATDWTPAPEDLATSQEFNDYKQTSEGYFQRIQSIETDLKSGLTYTKIHDIKITADRAESTIAQITDGDVTAYNQKISTALGDIQTIKDADYATQISNIAGRINVQIVSNADGSKSMMDMTSNQLLYNIDGGKIQVTQDKFYMDQTLIVPIIQTTKLSATQIESGTLDANKANIINLNVANLVGQNADLVRGSFNAINTSINIDGTALTTKGNWGGDIKLSNRGLTIYDNLANREMGVLYGLFRGEDDPYADRFMLATGLFAGYGYKLNLGLRRETTKENYSIISLDTSEEHGFYQMNVFGDILARYDLKMFGGMLTGAANAGYTVTDMNGGHCIEFANGWKIQFWRSSYQTFSSGWTAWTFPKRFTSIPRVVLAQAMRDDENFTPCNAYALNYQACNIRIQDKTLQWTIVAIAIGR